MQDTQSIQLAAFEVFGRTPVRIEWFGDVIYGGRSGGPGPRINVNLARHEDGRWICGSGTDAPLVVSVPIGFLRLLRIGDVWILGKCVGRDDGFARLTFNDLLIDDTTADVRPAGCPIDVAADVARYPLDFARFDAHRHHTGSYCVRVRLSDDRSDALIIPCVEVIRFYFGASGALVRRLFSGALAMDSLYTQARLNSRNGDANVTLADGLPFLAGTAVARIALDGRARMAAARVAKSGVVAAANGERYYPRTTFPFVGRTNLTVEGRWLDNEGGRTFFVDRLCQCTHPFPFQRLFVRTAKGVIGDGTADRYFRSVSANDRWRRRHSSSLVDDHVVASLMPVGVTADNSGVPFPDLSGKAICRVSTTDAVASRGRVSEGQHELSSGDDASRLGVRGAEISAAEVATSTRYRVPREVVALWDAADDYAFYEGDAWLVSLVDGGGHKIDYDYLPLSRADTIFQRGEEWEQCLWCARFFVSNEPERCVVVLIRPRGRQHSARTALIAFRDDSDDESLNAYEAFALGTETVDQIDILAEVRDKDTVDRDALLRMLQTGLVGNCDVSVLADTGKPIDDH